MNFSWPERIVRELTAALNRPLRPIRSDEVFWENVSIIATVGAMKFTYSPSIYLNFRSLS